MSDPRQTAFPNSSPTERAPCAVDFIERFDDKCRQNPKATAAVCPKESISYGALRAAADFFAERLRAQGVGQNEIVGICLDRSLDLAISLLGVLKAGGAYLPLDPRYPTDRLRYMAEDARLRFVICAEEYQNLFLSSDRTLIAGPHRGSILATFHRNAGSISSSAIENQESTLKSASGGLGYVIYTSGSTGKPKGVTLGRKALSNLIDWQLATSSAGLGTRTLQFTPISFDVHFQEFFGTWCSGGTLYLIGDEERLDPDRLLDFLIENRIERILLPFVALSALAEMAEATGKIPNTLSEVITAGEQLKITTALRWFFTQLPGCTLANHYGPSETHVVTAHVLCGSPADWPDLPPIGRPIPNVEIHLLGEGNVPVPDGETGELYIAGAALAEGYLNRPQLTAERFVNIDSVRMYRTGDLARKLPDETIEFLGRSDDQVKIRGFRIELGEIEVALISLPEVQQAVVIARENESGSKNLHAFVREKEGQTIDPELVRHALTQRLPDYMIPATIERVDSFPRTPSGKIDRLALASHDRKRPECQQQSAPPRTKTERLLANLWKDLLRLGEVGVDDNFFELGGNSLLAIRCATRLRAEQGIELPVARLYEKPILSTLAASLDGKPSEQHTRRQDIQNRSQDVAIVGMACQFPGAPNIDALWQSLCAGVESISFFKPDELDPAIPSETRARPEYVPARGILRAADQFDPAFFGMTPREAELMDPQQRLFLETAWQALEDAGHVPESFAGRIGVFGGTHNNSYYRENVQLRPDLAAGLGELPTMVGNEKDYVATRVAHKLDLRGPALAIQTACSTSLVAVAMAVQSLQSGQCDLALAGGAAVTVPQKSGHLYQEGGMLSPDGHCRPFDTDAKGTVFSDGVGLVVLRPLEDALREGDRVYAVIRGAAVNNDGREKASFSAPSVAGQVDVIAAAHSLAGIYPATIDYVEAHGTATPLGDPIEVEALRQAFESTPTRRQFCALGSIKSNFGHLTAAAGVAGLIKVALSLWHEQIPATLHFECPNPAIDFAKSPFYVNAGLRSWPQNHAPRRAAVSSFGVGGTNAHVVLEEAPAMFPEESSRPSQLLLLSAKSADSLEAASSNLAEFLEQHPDVNLADVAYTLQAGRAAFDCRRAIFANNPHDAAQHLRKKDPRQVFTASIMRKRREVVFLFPGQGAQSPNMGRRLYRLEPVFQRAVDECLELIAQHMEDDLRAILFPEVEDATSAGLLKQTANAQPALFTIEYALARLWMSWGIEPTAMIGHSIGEFAAACLAGVFRLEDALKLVAIRGREMQRLSKGSMLSVRLSAADLQRHLRGRLSIAAINGPKLCVASGPVDEIDALRQNLESETIPCSLLKTSHAFHSELMQPLVEPFTEVVRGVARHAPQLPIISTVTGKELTEEEATSPEYWGEQLRLPVRFSDAVGQVWSDPARVLLEVGPRSTLTTLTRQQMRDAKLQLAVASLEEPGDDDAEWQSLLRAVGQLWIHGIAIDPAELYRQEKRLRISLPTYPFERRRCWADPPERSASTVLTRKMETMKESNRSAIATILTELLEQVSGIDVTDFEPSASFLEMGLDSLLLTQIATTVERRMKVKVTFRQLVDELSSVALLTAYLEDKVPADVLPTRQPEIEPSRLFSEQPSPKDFAADGPLPVAGSMIEQVVTQQLEIMRQQLELLRRVPASVTHESVSPHPMPARNGSANGTQQAEPKEEPKPFGAAARIKLTSAKLDARQQESLKRIAERYGARTKRSKEMTQQNRPHLADPRVVSGFRPETKELVYPIVVERSKGSKLWDVDGNEYVDLTCGFGSNFFGNSADFIKEALEAQLVQGYEIGPQHILAGEVARGICDLTGLDRTAFCNTGSEAVLGALRLARTVTGRDAVAMFTGAYHGIVDEVIVRPGKNFRSLPAAPGIPPSAVEKVLVLEYGSDESLTILRERAGDLAAVLVEPVQSRRPELQPREFLRSLREITATSQTALIFDEVITGFRIHPGGAQAHFGIKADLATYGKVIGGGMPIGIIVGCRHFMDALDGGTWQFGDDSFPAVGVTYFAGTFVRHPLALAAAKAVVSRLKAEGILLSEQLNAKTAKLVGDINLFLKERNAPIHLDNFGSLFKVHYLEEQPYGELLYTLLRDRGVHIWDARPCFLTTAHSAEDLQHVQKAFREAVIEMQEAGFLPPAPTALAPTRNGKSHDRHASEPPVPGARLGKDPLGKPAWYVSDPARPGKFIQLGEAL